MNDNDKKNIKITLASGGNFTLDDLAHLIGKSVEELEKLVSSIPEGSTEGDLSWLLKELDGISASFLANLQEAREKKMREPNGGESAVRIKRKIDTLLTLLEDPKVMAKFTRASKGEEEALKKIQPTLEKIKAIVNPPKKTKTTGTSGGKKPSIPKTESAKYKPIPQSVQKGVKNDLPKFKEELLQLAETLEKSLSAHDKRSEGEYNAKELAEVHQFIAQLRKKALAADTPSMMKEISELTKIDKEIERLGKEQAQTGKANNAMMRQLKQKRAETFEKLKKIIPADHLKRYASKQQTYSSSASGTGKFAAMPVPTKLDTGFNADGSQRHDYSIDDSAAFNGESDYETMKKWFKEQPTTSGSSATSGKSRKTSITRKEAKELYEAMKKGGTEPIQFRGQGITREQAKSLYNIHMGGSRGTAFHRLQEIVPADKIADKDYIKSLLYSDELSKEDKQLFADLRDEKDTVSKEAKFNQFYGTLQRESALQKHDNAVAHELTVGASVQQNGKRRILTGTADKVIQTPDGRLAMSDYKTQNSEIKAKEIVQQIVYRYLLNVNKDHLGLSGKVEDMYIDHTPFDKDTSTRYKITGVTDASEAAILDKVLSEADNPTMDDKQWNDFLKSIGVDKQEVTPAVKTGYSTFDKLGFETKKFGSVSAQEAEYREYERVFWEKYGPFITKILEGDTESKKEFSEAWNRLIQKGKDVKAVTGKKVSSNFLTENYGKIHKLLNGDASGFIPTDGGAPTFSVPSITRAQGTQYNGQWLSKVFKTREETNKLVAQFPTLSKAEQEQILSSVFAHKDFETGEELGHYRDFGAGYDEKTAAKLRENSEYFRAQFRKPIPAVGTPAQKEQMGEYSGLAIGGRFLKDYQVQYEDAIYRGDAETAENIKQILISAYEQMSKSMRGLIEQNLEAASVGNRTQEDDDTILVRQGQIQEMQNALHTMETIFGENVLSGRGDSNIQDSYWNEMSIMTDIAGGDYHMQSDPTEKIEHRKEHPTNAYQEEKEDTYGENGIPYKDLHGTDKSVSVTDAERTGHVISQLIDIVPRITKFFSKYVREENAKRAREGKASVSEVEFARTYLARNNPAMFRDFERGLMLQEELDARRVQREAEADKKGENYTWTDEAVFKTLVEILGGQKFSFDEETVNAMDMYSDLTVYGDPGAGLTNIAKDTFIERQKNIREGKSVFKNADGDIEKTLKGRLAAGKSMKGWDNLQGDALEDAISQGKVSEELERRREAAAKGFSIDADTATRIAEQNGEEPEIPKELFAIEDKYKRLVALLDSPETKALMEEQGIKKGQMEKYLQAKKKEEMFEEIFGDNWGRIKKKYIERDSEGRLKLNATGLKMQGEYFDDQGYNDKEASHYDQIMSRLVGDRSAKNFQSSSKIDLEGKMRGMFSSLEEADFKNDPIYQRDVRIHDITQDLAEEQRVLTEATDEIYEAVSAEIQKDLDKIVDEMIEEKLSKKEEGGKNIDNIPSSGKGPYKTPSIEINDIDNSGVMTPQLPKTAGKQNKYTKYSWNDSLNDFYWLKKDGSFSKERVADENLSTGEKEKRDSIAIADATAKTGGTPKKGKVIPFPGTTSPVEDPKKKDVHVTSDTPFSEEGQRLVQTITDDMGNIIGKTYQEIKEKVLVDWGKDGRQGFIDRHKDKPEEKTIADITKILSRKEYNYTKKDGSLNAAGTQVLEKMLKDIYGKGGVGPSDPSNIHIDHVDTIDIDNAVTVNINGGIIKDGSRRDEGGRKDNHTERDNKNASDRANKALDYLKEELKLEEALTKIQNDKSKLNERNTLIQQITELKKARELLEHNMSDSELAMYGADAAKLSPQHTRKISQILARQEDKDTVQAAKDADKAEKEAEKEARKEAARIDAEAAASQAEKEAASTQSLAASNKLLKQKLGYEKELIKIQAKVNKLQEDGTEAVQEDIKKLEERMKELRDLIANTDTKYQTAKEGVTEEKDVDSIFRAEEEYERKIKDAERRAKWAEEDKKAKATGGEVTVDPSKISQKDQETLREARILQAQLYKAKNELAAIGREAKALQEKQKSTGTLSGEEQERLGLLLDRKSEYQSTVNDLTKKWDNQAYETDAGWQAARLLKQGKEGNFKLSQKGKSIQFADKQQQVALREYEQILQEILRKEERLYQIRMQKSTSTNKREINALEQEERLLSSQVDLLRKKHEEQKKNPALLKQGAEDTPQLIEGALTANAEFESKQAAIEAKTFSQNKGATSIWQQIGANFQTSIQRVFNYGAAMKIVQSIPQSFKKIIAISKELDAVMTDLRVVTGYNRAEAINLMKSYNGLAKSLGVTTQEVAKSADTWLRQGYSVADTNQLITSTMYLAKLGQIESGQASQYMTSMLKGFKLEASEAMSVVDKLVALDKQYAVTAGGVAEALSRTAVSAQMAGVELDKIAAMVTVITDVSQKSADSVGESMKTLFARYGNVKSGVFEDLTDSSGETTENINDIEKVLNSVGIRVRSSSLEFREMDDVLEELAGKWIGLTTVEKNAIATAMAGTRQRENFNIMMENYDEILKATETSLNANGTAEKGYAAITESVSYQMNQMANAWDQLALQMDTNPIFVQLTKWGVDLLEVLPQIIQYVLTFISITKSKALLGGLKDFGLGATNALFGTKFGYEKSSNVGKSAGLFNKNGVSKDFLGKETGKINSTLEDILRAIQGKAVRDSGSALGSNSDNYSTYLKLSSSDNKKSRQLAKKMSNPLYEMAQEQGVTAEGFEEFEAKMSEMAKVVGEATAWQRKKMQADMNSIVQSKKEAMEKAKSRAESAKADMEFVLASKTATKAEREAAIANEHEARASYEAAQADYNEAQGQQGNLNTLVGKANKQTRANGWKQAGSAALSSGIMGGITSAVGAYATTEGDEEDKKNAAIKQGTGSAVGTAIGALGYAIPYVGAIVGPITTSLGGMIGNVIGEKSAEAERERKYAEQNAAKKRAEQGEKALQILQSSNGAMEQMSSMVRTKDDWTADDEVAMESYIDSVKETLYLDSGLREEFVNNVKALNEGLISTNDPIEGFKEALTVLTEGTEEQAREVMRQLELAKLQREKEELENSQALEDYQNRKLMSTAIGASGKVKDNKGVAAAFAQLQREGFDVTYDESTSWFQTYFDASYSTRNKSNEKVISEIELIIERLLARQASTGDDLSDVIESFEAKLEGYKGALANQDSNRQALNELNVKTAFTQSDVYMWDAIDIKNATLNEAIDEVADNLTLLGINVRDYTGKITDEARGMILSELKSDTRYAPLMNTGTQKLNKMLENDSLLSFYIDQLNKAGKNVSNYSDLLSIFTHETDENLKKQQEYAEQLGISVDELRNIVYKTDPENLNKFAQELGFTVDELEAMKHTLGGYTLSDLFAVPEKTIERYEQLTELLSTITSMGTMTASTLETIVDKYPELMQGADGSFSMSNVENNILSAFGIGSETAGIQNIYAKQFYEQLKNNDAFYTAFLQQIKNKYSTTIDGKKVLTEQGQGIVKRLGQFSTFTDEALQAIVAEDYRGADGEFQYETDTATGEKILQRQTAIGEGFADMYNSFIGGLDIEVDLLKDFRKMLGELKIKEYEQEQQNLKDVLEGLESINAQREKELELIKAKQKLENAAKEKVLRYREGLGFVYEQDTSKVKEAQEEVDKLEEEIQKSSIQYQIDQLEVQKSTLNALLNNETKSQDLLAQIEKNTSVLSIISSGADVDRSEGVSVSVGGNSTEVDWEGLLADLTKQYGLTNEQILELYKTFNHWGDILTHSMSFEGDVTISANGSLVLGDGTTIEGNFNGTLTSQDGKLSGTLETTDEEGKKTYVTGDFEFDGNGNLVVAEGSQLIIRGQGDGQSKTIDASAASALLFQTGTSASGTLNGSFTTSNGDIVSGEFTLTENGDLVPATGTTFTLTGKGSGQSKTIDASAASALLFQTGTSASGTLNGSFTTSNGDIVSGEFTVASGGLTPASGTVFTLNGTGLTKIISAQQAANAKFQFTNGKATGTLTPADGSGQWSASGTVHFGEQTKLTIASGEVTYTGNMTFSGTGNSFQVKNGSLSGSFVSLTNNKASLSGTLDVDTTNGLRLTGDLKVDDKAYVTVDYTLDSSKGVEKGTNGFIAQYNPKLKLTYSWDPDGPQGKLDPTIKIDYDVSGATKQNGVWNYADATVQANLKIWDASDKKWVTLGQTDKVNLGSTEITWKLNPNGPDSLTWQDLFDIQLDTLDLSNYIKTKGTVTLDSISIDDVLAIDSSGTTMTNTTGTVQLMLNEQAALDLEAAFKAIYDYVDSKTNEGSDSNPPEISETIKPDEKLMQWLGSREAVEAISSFGYNWLGYQTDTTIKAQSVDAQGNTVYEDKTGKFSVADVLRETGMLSTTNGDYWQKKELSDAEKSRLDTIISNYNIQDPEATEALKQELIQIGIPLSNLEQVTSDLTGLLMDNLNNTTGTSNAEIAKARKATLDEFEQQLQNGAVIAYGYDTSRLTAILMDPTAQKTFEDTQGKTIENMMKEVEGTVAGGFEMEKAGSSSSPYQDFTLTDVVQVARVPQNASGGVYDEDSIIRVAEYSDSATDPEIVAPQSIIADTMSSVIEDSGISNNLNTKGPVVSSASLMVGKGRQKQSDDLSKSVKELTATGENLVTSGGNIVQVTDNAITTVDNLSGVIDTVSTVLSNVIEEDGTINPTFIASIVSAAVEGMVSSAALAFAGAVAEGVASIGNLFAKSLSAIWNGAKTVVNTIGEGLSTVGEGVKSVASNVWDGAKSVASNVWDGAKSVASNVWDGTKSVASDVWDGVKSGFKTVGGWLGIVDNASGGVYDDETIVRVAEYTDSATDPEVIAPQSVIEESLLSALQKEAGDSEETEETEDDDIQGDSYIEEFEKNGSYVTQNKSDAALEEKLSESDFGQFILSATDALDALSVLAYTLSNTSSISDIIDSVVNALDTMKDWENVDIVTNLITAVIDGILLGIGHATEDERLLTIVEQCAEGYFSGMVQGYVRGVKNIALDLFGEKGFSNLFGGDTDEEGIIAEIGNNTLIPLLDSSKDFLQPVGEVATGIIHSITDGFNWIGDRTWRKWGHANGTLDAPGGLSMINEPWAGGTEAIVTPTGTITALPSHTGIVPADLTRNLYKLGEVAPNLIRDTYHSSQESLMNAIHNSKMIEDNSISIQKLDAVFQVNENFDFDKFLTEVRGVVSTTKNNR